MSNKLDVSVIWYIYRDIPFFILISFLVSLLAHSVFAVGCIGCAPCKRASVACSFLNAQINDSMAERLNALVLKTRGLNGSVGSTPTAVAK